MFRLALCLLLLQTVAAENELCQLYTMTKEQDFKSLVLTGLAQILPDSTQDELAPILGEAQALGISCCSATPEADCEISAMDLLTCAACYNASLVERNNLKSCCEKDIAVRGKCFREQRSVRYDPSILTPAPESPAEELCADIQRDKRALVDKTIFSYSKVNAMMPPALIVSFAKKYSETVESCCGEAEPKSCLSTKKAALEASFRSRTIELKAICLTEKKYGQRVSTAKKVVEYSQKFPQVPVKSIQEIVEKTVTFYTPCCQGDMFTCLKLQDQVFNEMCSTFNASGLTACCSEDIFNRGRCISNLKPVPKLEGLSEHYDLHADIQAVCHKFSESPKEAMINLLYEVSRRHPEASKVVILRYAKAAEQAFSKCCASEDRAECVQTAMAKDNLEEAIAKDLTHYRGNEAVRDSMGDRLFEIGLITQYTRTMPQASFDILHHASKAVAQVFDECLKDVSDQEILACEDKLTDVIDIMCHIYDPENINTQSTKCCTQTYSTRILCVLDMKADTDFKPPELDLKSLQIVPEICTKEGEDLLLAEKKLFYGLVRHNTTVTGEALNQIYTSFNTIKESCCSEDKETCFNTKSQQVTDEISKLLSGGSASAA